MFKNSRTQEFCPVWPLLCYTLLPSPPREFLCALDEGKAWERGYKWPLTFLECRVHETLAPLFPHPLQPLIVPLTRPEGKLLQGWYQEWVGHRKRLMYLTALEDLFRHWTGTLREGGGGGGGMWQLSMGHWGRGSTLRACLRSSPTTQIGSPNRGLDCVWISWFTEKA